MFGLSLLNSLLIIWAVLTSAFVLLIIYRSIIGMHEDDQLFLHPGEARLMDEQTRTIQRLSRTRPYMQALGALSGVLVLVIAGLWLYQGMLSR